MLLLLLLSPLFACISLQALAAWLGGPKALRWTSAGTATISAMLLTLHYLTPELERGGTAGMASFTATATWIAFFESLWFAIRFRDLVNRYYAWEKAQEENWK